MLAGRDQKRERVSARQRRGIAGTDRERRRAPVLTHAGAEPVEQRTLVLVRGSFRPAQRDVQEQAGEDLAAQRKVREDFLILLALENLVLP